MIPVGELNLAEPANTIARYLAWTFPEVIFTSGRRMLSDQAHAMAENIRLNRNWIQQTYVPSHASLACQSYVDDATTGGDIAAGLLAVLAQFSDVELAKLSKHLSGEAFDIMPVNDPVLIGWLHARAAAVGGKFLTREGGLARFHFEVDRVKGAL